MCLRQSYTSIGFCFGFDNFLLFLFDMVLDLSFATNLKRNLMAQESYYGSWTLHSDTLQSHKANNVSIITINSDHSIQSVLHILCAPCTQNMPGAS